MKDDCAHALDEPGPPQLPLLHLTLRLDPATVIIAPNDAGKSTILDAIRCLLSDTDRNGERFERRTVVTMRDLDLFLGRVSMPTHR